MTPIPGVANLFKSGGHLDFPEKQTWRLIPES
jgi:hypothetical protein